jgi:hypothetical protein
MNMKRITEKSPFALAWLFASTVLFAACLGDTTPPEESDEDPSSSAAAVTGTTVDISLPAGDVRVYRPATAPAACEAVLFGVGTGLTTTSYASLGSAINGQGHVFVVMDHAPGDTFDKADAARYAALVEDVKANLLGWLGAGSPCTGIAHWILGGHSASGQAAHAAVLVDPRLGHAVFSADPYDVSGLGTISLPGLYWGFTATSCFVDVNKAARAAYYRTPSPGRVLHKTNVTMTRAWCGYAPKYHHQSFIDYGADLGSLGCNSCVRTPSSFYADVADSLSKFITARFYGTWSKANLRVASGRTPAALHVDGDRP